MKFITALAVFGALSSAQAAKIAVIDSGLDYKHEMIVPNLWTNANETFDRRDEDGNGYQDDVHGWNFAEQNGQIIDYKYIGTFSPDTRKYFDIQGKYFMKLATEEEIAWMRAKQKDPKFIKELGKFGNFVHGTHVSGITIRESENEVMGIKLIPTEVKPFFDGLSAKGPLVADRWELLATAFNALAAEQMKLLTTISKFADFHQADIINGSFGTGFNQAKMISTAAYRIVFLKKPSKEDSDRAAALFLNALIKEGSKFLAGAPNTLFVFASGNDGLSNDTYGTSPANIKADNSISVGATYKNEFFAPFSNYGTKTVDIAAPGMLIDSAIPGGEYLKVSGTSQASPFVANVAGRIKDANGKLTPLEIKQILMGTVDKKAFLTEKVASGGIVNTERAVVAAQMTKTMSLSESIKKAHGLVKDMPSESLTPSDFNRVAPMPLQRMFQ